MGLASICYTKIYLILLTPHRATAYQDPTILSGKTSTATVTKSLGTCNTSFLYGLKQTSFYRLLTTHYSRITTPLQLMICLILEAMKICEALPTINFVLRDTLYSQENTAICCLGIHGYLPFWIIAIPLLMMLWQGWG